jgi:hypothetical protein
MELSALEKGLNRIVSKEKPCKFCEAMKVNRQIEEFTRQHESPKDLERYGKYKTEYAVAIITRSWYSKSGKKHATRTTDYMYTGLGYKLNYCPECGRELKA